MRSLTLIMNYQYDPVGNIIQLEYNRRLPDQTWEQSLETFSYDWLDRLTSAQGEYGSLSYTYDPVGNRLSQNDTTYTYNAMNELTSTSDGKVFTYDDKGNVISKVNTDTWSYTYERNTLAKVEKNQQTLTEYTYDGGGKRITKTEWIEDLQEYHTKIYVYSGLQVVYEKNVTTGQEASYVYGPAGKIAKHVNSTTDFYHTDHLGSTRLITDENGDVLTTVEYNPFGEDTITGEKESFSYTGKEKDSSGLYYYGARYYDPEIGRFISRDPVRGRKITPQTLNPYSYCLNNPLKYIDPDGRDPLHYKPVKGNRALQYSHAPQLMDYVYIEYDYTSFLVICAGIGIVLGGIALAMVIEAFIACAAMWWAGMSPLAKSVLIGIIIQMIIEGAKWVIRRVFGDGKFEEIETETGYVVINRETEEIIEGDRIHEGVHQVWVHVPGEGPLGGHWEDDVDCDGVPSSVDDDDNDPEVGDEDSNVP